MSLLVIKTPIMLPVGYVDWVYPWRITEGVPYLMLGDHNAYSPVKFFNAI